MNKVAIYIRLSVEDIKTDSLSIDGQRKFLHYHIKQLPEYADAEIIEFVDNGHSGTNFERPAIQELLDLVKENAISCILVKDFTRFGRDLLQVGYFLEKVFPLFRTRFVSVDDLYDSNNFEQDTGGIDVTFKYLIGEYYSRDLSVKSKMARYSRMKQGKYQSENCCYGFQKGADGKLEIDNETADNVRLIFDLSLNGATISEIANELYKRNISTPAEHKASKGKNFYNLTNCHGIWHGTTLLNILRDEKYAGTYIMGKTTVKKIGSTHMRLKDESEWYKLPNHHAPIISMEVYKQVQQGLRTFKCPRKNSSSYPLKGLVFCGICGHKMQRVPKKIPVFRCRYTSAITEFPCYGIEENECALEEVVWNIINKQAAIIFNLDNIVDVGQLDFQTTQKKTYAIQIEELNAKKMRLYERYLTKEITLDEYIDLKLPIDKDLFPLTSTHSSLKAQTDQLKLTNSEKKERLQLATEISNENVLNRALVEALIEKVLIYPNKQVEVVCKMKDFACLDGVG